MADNPQAFSFRGRREDEHKSVPQTKLMNAFAVSLRHEQRAAILAAAMLNERQSHEG